MLYCVRIKKIQITIFPLNLSIHRPIFWLSSIYGIYKNAGIKFSSPLRHDFCHFIRTMLCEYFQSKRFMTVPKSKNYQLKQILNISNRKSSYLGLCGLLVATRSGRQRCPCDNRTMVYGKLPPMTKY